MIGIKRHEARFSCVSDWARSRAQKCARDRDGNLTGNTRRCSSQWSHIDPSQLHVVLNPTSTEFRSGLDYRCANCGFKPATSSESPASNCGRLGNVFAQHCMRIDGSNPVV
ncbi:hypothetical protein RB195_019907 [Necator americanus]|uniref:Uncharacterized protein n=1 Tax=Necator americanus TaxID=51031 RepID=A0ABR1CII4_NECAM